MFRRYRCLFLDHDDTAVDSTATIHYPAHLEVMSRMRPSTDPVSLEEWLSKNFHPGIMEYLREELGLSDEEIVEEGQIWRDYARKRTAPFFDGVLPLLRRFQDQGGYVVVVSHSHVDLIERDYRVGGEGILPDLIYGWEYEECCRKPSPFPVVDALRRLPVSPDESLVVDDLRPGVEMAKAAGVDVVAAGWGHRIPEIEEYMRANCIRYFTTVQELDQYLFSDL